MFKDFETIKQNKAKLPFSINKTPVPGIGVFLLLKLAS